MNKKGQSLVLFIFLIPLLIMAFAFIFDSAIIVTENSKFRSIAETTLETIANKNMDLSKARELINKNDVDIEIIEISSNTLHLRKDIESYFGKIVGYEKYELEINLIANYKNDTLNIEERE